MDCYSARVQLRKETTSVRRYMIYAGLLVLLCTGLRGEEAMGQDDANQPSSQETKAQSRPAELRNFINSVVPLELLKVPELDTDIPQPTLPDGSLDPFFALTPERVYLGKQLFFDPVRSNNIQPEFGGVPATSQTASCGSCHIGDVAGKAGTVINGAVGFEGRGYTTASGEFIFRRRIIDGLVDTIPTLTEIFDDNGEVIASGMFDAVDSVPRLSPNLVGFAFNTRLLLGGLAGEPGDTNPNGFNAQNNLTELTISVHRMLETQAAALQAIPVYVKLFTDAFPAEAAAAQAAGNLDLLINDDTVTRAMADFLRTVVTRNTPWDKFLAGDDNALTPAQQRGARLFFTSAEGGLGGAGCVSCHSGPQLNKQIGDEVGTGTLVEENFFNIGLGDHPLQALNGEVFGDPDFRDIGRMLETDNPDDMFEFRSVTLRQAKTVRQFMHDGSFTSVKDVVEYFNAGIPNDSEAAAAPTFSPRFSNPRGAGFPPGLGLSEQQVDDLTDFIENGLYDPALVEFDPDSTTNTFELNEEDLTYSVFRPELAALGAVDGLVASGLAIANNDGLSRRDMGLEFLDVTGQVRSRRIASRVLRRGRLRFETFKLTNSSSSVVDTNLLIVVENLSPGAQLLNKSGTTSDGKPFIRVFLDENDGTLVPGGSVVSSLRFLRSPRAPRLSFSLKFLSGQGTP